MSRTELQIWLYNFNTAPILPTTRLFNFTATKIASNSNASNVSFTNFRPNIKLWNPHKSNPHSYSTNGTRRYPYSLYYKLKAKVPQMEIIRLPFHRMRNHLLLHTANRIPPRRAVESVSAHARQSPTRPGQIPRGKEKSRERGVNSVVDTTRTMGRIRWGDGLSHRRRRRRRRRRGRRRRKEVTPRGIC